MIHLLKGCLRVAKQAEPASLCAQGGLGAVGGAGAGPGAAGALRHGAPGDDGGAAEKGGGLRGSSWLWVKTVLGSHFGVGAPPI